MAAAKNSDPSARYPLKKYRSKALGLSDSTCSNGWLDWWMG